MSVKDLFERVAVIDDDRDQAETLAYQIEALGLQPLVIEGTFDTPADLVTKVSNVSAHAVICDHRLAERGMASFDGAEAVKDFFLGSLPSVLLTQFVTIDANETIRRWKEWVPQVVSRQETQSSASPLIISLYECWRELQGDIPIYRQRARSMLEIKHRDDAAIDVVVHNWRPLEAVRLPLDLITDEDLRNSIKAGDYLIASVNSGATRPEDLYFADVHAAPDPSRQLAT